MVTCGTHNAKLQASKPILKTILCYFHIEFSCNNILAHTFFLIICWLWLIAIARNLLDRLDFFSTPVLWLKMWTQYYATLGTNKGSSYVSHGVNRSGSDSEAWKQQPIWCKPSLNYEQNITKYQLVPADNRSLSVSKLQALQWAARSNTHTAFYFFMRCRFKKPFTAQRRYSSSSHDSSLVTIRTERKSLSDFPLSFAELRWQMTVVLVSEDQL